MKNSAPTAHSPFWSKPEAPSADQVEAEAKAAELGEILRNLVSGPDGPENGAADQPGICPSRGFVPDRAERRASSSTPIMKNGGS